MTTATFVPNLPGTLKRRNCDPLTSLIQVIQPGRARRRHLVHWPTDRHPGLTLNASLRFTHVEMYTQGAPTDSGDFYFDDFEFQDSTVPEPASALMALPVFAALGILRIRGGRRGYDEGSRT